METNTKVSKFFSYGELWRSEGANRLGINNEPTPEHLENLIWYAAGNSAITVTCIYKVAYKIFP